MGACGSRPNVLDMEGVAPVQLPAETPVVDAAVPDVKPEETISANEESTGESTGNAEEKEPLLSTDEEPNVEDAAEAVTKAEEENVPAKAEAEGENEEGEEATTGGKLHQETIEESKDKVVA